MREASVIRLAVFAAAGSLSAVGLASQESAGSAINQPVEPPAATPAEAPATPASDPQAIQILEASSQAIKRARAITYNGHYKPVGGVLQGALGEKRGAVKMLRAPLEGAAPTPDDPFVVLVSGTDLKNQSPIDAAFHAGTIEWLDRSAKKLIERPALDPAVRNKTTQGSKELRHDEFLKPLPIVHSLDKATAQMGASETIDGVECDAVTITRQPNRTERWYIASTDRFPRRIVTVMPGGNGEIILELASVTVEASDTPSLTPAMMRLALPEGFTEDRRTAPPPPPRNTNMANPVANPNPNTSQGQATFKPAPPAPPKPPEPVVAPEFDLVVGRGVEDVATGTHVKLADVKGGVIVLDFFGTWTLAAPQWHAEFKSLAADNTTKGVKFFTLNVREKSGDAAIAYMEREKVGAPLLMNADAVAKAYGVRVYPATVVIGRDGKIVELIQGSRSGGESKEKVQKAIEKALIAGEVAKPAEGPAPTVEPADPK